MTDWSPEHDRRLCATVLYEYRRSLEATIAELRAPAAELASAVAEDLTNVREFVRDAGTGFHAALEQRYGFDTQRFLAAMDRAGAAAMDLVEATDGYLVLERDALDGELQHVEIGVNAREVAPTGGDHVSRTDQLSAALRGVQAALGDLEARIDRDLEQLRIAPADFRLLLDQGRGGAELGEVEMRRVMCGAAIADGCARDRAHEQGGEVLLALAAEFKDTADGLPWARVVRDGELPGYITQQLGDRPVGDFDARREFDQAARRLERDRVMSGRTPEEMTKAPTRLRFGRRQVDGGLEL